MSPQEQVRAKCKEVIALAMQRYGVDLARVVVKFDLRGRAAGMAMGRQGTYTVRFNHDMIARGDEKVLRDMIEDTVPHEFAHIVCFMRRNLGSNHDAGWRQVCIALGGSGGRTHEMEVVYGKGLTYEYTTDAGHRVRVGDRHHAYVQSGRPLRFRKGKGNVDSTCAYSIVGQNGRTLATPIVKRTANHPAEIEAAVRAGTKEVPAQTLLIQVPAPVQREAAVVQRVAPGESKAATSRRLMLAGYRGGHSYEVIISAMIAACGYDRQLARATFKANASKVGIPVTFG
jgi:SprT protein